MGISNSYELLSQGVQYWLYSMGWSELRPIQEKAIPYILNCDRDILITAPTAGGKTEAAFLPLVSWIEENSKNAGYGVLCLSPLKALINDQFNRLEPLCERANTKITPWHGDVSQSIKKQSWQNPSGILLITPESLEAMFINRPNELHNHFLTLQYIVIDEFHAFIGSERGQQLLSLLTRVEVMIGKTIPRIALSATIGNPDMAIKFLRPGGELPGIHLKSDSEKFELQMVMKALSPDDDSDEHYFQMVAEELFGRLKGSNNLVFANSRRAVEAITDQLRQCTEKLQIPEEFFTHHGSLSRNERHVVENRLRSGTLPTTAIATSTLELGIDIGSVTSVAQIGAPSNVSSIRQRLGRSGRRGEHAKLRLLIKRTGQSKNKDFLDCMNLELFQSIAIINLMFKKWIEPVDNNRFHCSTLIQQILSMIAFKGDITADHAFNVLCRKGPWQAVDPSTFAWLLRGMGQADLIQQLNSGELIVGLSGEKLISNYDFYTAFKTPEEYQLINKGNKLGTLPLTSPYIPGQLLIFGGRRWKIDSIDSEAKTLFIIAARRGKIPKFDGEAAPVHKEIRLEMETIYNSKDFPAFCDEATRQYITETRKHYSECGLCQRNWFQSGDDIYWIVWESDTVLNTIILILTSFNIKTVVFGPILCVENIKNIHEIIKILKEAVEKCSTNDLAQMVPCEGVGKFDQYLPDELKKTVFAMETVNLNLLKKYLKKM